MDMDDLLDLARRIAREAHAGQTDKIDRPFVDHLERVASTLTGTEQQMVALLHDVVEKGEGWTLHRLSMAGFPQTVVDAVDALTRREGESDIDLASRAASNALAKPVKMADLRDNQRQAEATNGDIERYAEVLRFMTSREEKR